MGIVSSFFFPKLMIQFCRAKHSADANGRRAVKLLWCNSFAVPLNSLKHLLRKDMNLPWFFTLSLQCFPGKIQTGTWRAGVLVLAKTETINLLIGGWSIPITSGEFLWMAHGPCTRSRCTKWWVFILVSIPHYRYDIVIHTSICCSLMIVLYACSNHHIPCIEWQPRNESTWPRIGVVAFCSQIIIICWVP